MFEVPLSASMGRPQDMQDTMNVLAQILSDADRTRRAATASQVSQHSQEVGKDSKKGPIVLVANTDVPTQARRRQVNCF